MPARTDLARPRLPIDRAFTIAGFGTVVTGTLSDGSLHIGDEVEILPSGGRGRVRGLQTHKHKEDTAVPGSRTAVNISGISLDEVQRGEVVAHPGDYRPSKRLDAHFRLLPDASKSLRHNTQVKRFIGASETVARLRLLGSEELHPGSEGWLQLEPVQPVVVARGDHYILRRTSPGETLGGGVVVDPHPGRRHKRFSQDALDKLEALARGTPTDILHQAVLEVGAAPLKDALNQSNLEASEAKDALEELLASEQIFNLENDGPPGPKDLVISQVFWEGLSASALQEVERYHMLHPLRSGIPREELKSRLERRATESAHSVGERLRRAKEELKFEHRFDHVIINDRLDDAVAETIEQVSAFLSAPSKNSAGEHPESRP